MPTPPGGLGRGLDALLGGSLTPDGPEVQMVPLAAIRPNPDQPRRTFAQEPLEELADSIRAQGVLQPILVRPRRGEGGQRYEIVAGERRYRAAGLAGLEEMPVLVKDMAADDALAVALVENLQRQDLNPMEEARGLKELQDRLGLSQEEVAGRIGKSRSAVANTLRLLQLSAQAQDDLLAGRLSAGHARQLLGMPDPQHQEELRRRIVEQGLSVRQAEELAAHVREHGDLPADAPRQAPKPQGGPRPRPPEELKAICAGLGRGLGLTIKVSGGPRQGAVSLHYATVEDLARILNALSRLNQEDA